MDTVKIHYLKTESRYFDRVEDGTKPFEARFNDRDFQKGDQLLLTEVWDPGEKDIHKRQQIEERPRTLRVEVTYILHNFPGLREGWVVLGVRKMEACDPWPVRPNPSL